MHVHGPTSLASTFWYTNLVGSIQVRHKMLRNPNGPYASLRKVNHSNSTSTSFVFPKLSKIIMNKVWVGWFTFGTILTQMSLSSTCVASVMFGFAWLRIILDILHLPHFGLHPWVRILISVVGVRLGTLGTNRPDRSRVTGLAGLVRSHLILLNGACCNKMSFFLASEAYPCTCTILFSSWKLDLVLGIHGTSGVFHVWLFALNKILPFSLTLLRSKGSDIWTLLKLLHHVITVILRRLHLTLLFSLVGFNFSSLTSFLSSSSFWAMRSSQQSATTCSTQEFVP